MQLHMAISNLDAVNRRLVALEQAASDFTPELTAVGDWLSDYFGSQVFATEGSIMGEVWLPLNPVYADWKAHHYPGAGILQATGALQQGWRKEVGPKQLRFYNNVPYAHAQNFGYAPRKLPARVFFKIEQAQRQKIHDIITQTLHSRLNG